MTDKGDQIIMADDQNTIESNTENKESTDLRSGLERMTKKELQAYANMTFGLGMKSESSKADLIDAILHAHSRFQGSREISKYDGSQLKPGYSRIKVSASPHDKSKRPVIVGLGGKIYSLPVGMEIVVPNFIVEILDNAVRFEYDQNPETLEMERRETHAYPFTVLARRETAEAA